MLHGTIIALIFYIFECLLKPITSVTENYSPIGCILVSIYVVFYVYKCASLQFIKSFVFPYGYNIHNYSLMLSLYTKFFATSGLKNDRNNFNNSVPRVTAP